MRGWTLLLAAAILVSGCISDGEDGDTVDSARVEDAAAGSASSSASASSAASGPGGAGASASAADANASGAAMAPEVVPVALEGSIPPFVAACGFTPVAGQCLETPGEWNNYIDLDIAGTGTGATLTVTWTAATPSTEELFLNFFSYTDDDFVMHATVNGPSPLAIALSDPIELPEGWTHRVGVGASSPGLGTPAGGAFAGVSPLEQPFSLVGELLVVRPAPANP